MPKFFFDPHAIRDGVVTLDGENARHLIKVLRIKEGDGLILCDGEAFDYDATVKSVSKDSLEAYLIKKYENPAEPETKITLFQGLPKGDKLSYIVEKAVEAGVCEIAPVLLKRSVARSDKKDFAKKAERYQKIAESAAKQSNRGVVPAVSELHCLEEVIARKDSFDLLLMPYECEKEHSLKAVLTACAGAKKVALIVGPEGGFDREEAQLLTKAGFRSVSLGTRILRTETAGIASIFQILYEYE